MATKAGTVFWLYQTAADTWASGLEDDGVIWLNNTAPYGEKYATQPTSMITESQYHVTEYDSPLDPPIVLPMLDFYGHRSDTASAFSVTLSISDYNCESLTGYLVEGCVN